MSVAQTQANPCCASVPFTSCSSDCNPPMSIRRSATGLQHRRLFGEALSGAVAINVTCADLPPRAQKTDPRGDRDRIVLSEGITHRHGRSQGTSGSILDQTRTAATFHARRRVDDCKHVVFRIQSSMHGHGWLVYVFHADEAFADAFTMSWPAVDRAGSPDYFVCSVLTPSVGVIHGRHHDAYKRHDT